MNQKMHFGPDIWMTASPCQGSYSFSQHDHIAFMKSEHAYAAHTSHIQLSFLLCDFRASLTLVRDGDGCSTAK